MNYNKNKNEGKKKIKKKGYLRVCGWLNGR
jgi:hypothetical protein